MTERKWDAVPLQSILANGGTEGQIVVSDSSLFKVKQRVTLFSDSTSPIEYVVNKIPSPTLLLLGQVGKEIYKYANVSIFLTADNAKISALEQNRPTITPHDFQRAAYEEEPTMAHRSVLVDKYGRRIDQANPLPTTATLDVGSLTVETALDAFTKNPPDNALSVGTEDGTKTGIKHVIKIDANNNLIVKDADALVALAAVVSALSATLNVSDSQTHALLNTIDSLLSGTLQVDDAQTQTVLNSILTQLQAGNLNIGTEDGTITGAQHVFVNNRYLQILAAKDRDQDIIYADFGTKDQRVTQVDYTAPSIGSGAGFTARKTFTYVLDGTKYKRTKITRFLV